MSWQIVFCLNWQIGVNLHNFFGGSGKHTTDFKLHNSAFQQFSLFLIWVFSDFKQVANELNCTCRMFFQGQRKNYFSIIISTRANQGYSPLKGVTTGYGPCFFV